MNPEHEKALVEKAKSSSEAFGELYKMYYSQIFGYALRRTADIDIAQDITSQVFLKALRNIRKYRWQGVPFSHWLYRIAGREILDYHNKNKRETVVEMSARIDVPVEPEELAAAKNELKKYDDFLDIQKYVSGLPPKYQEVITLRYFEDKSISEIALILDKPEGTIKSLVSRGIDRLRKMMESQSNK